MSYFIQNYGNGHIARDGNKYQLVDREDKVVGTYSSVDELVKANPVNEDGKQDRQVRGRVDAGEAAEGELASKGSTEGAKEKVTKRSAKK